MGSKDIAKMVAQFQSYLQPYLAKQSGMADYSLGLAKEDLGAGREGISELISYYSDFMGGDRDKILSNIDASGITKSFDDAEANLANYGTRGGRSAEMLSSMPFEKAASINKVVQEMRNMAPEKLQQLFAQLLGLGSSELSTALGANQSNLGALSGIVQMSVDRDAASQAAKAQIISGIFQAAGTGLGLWACFVNDTPVLVRGNDYIPASEIDTEVVGVLKNGHLYKDKIVDRQVVKNQIIYDVTTYEGNEIGCTKSHYFVVSLNPYVEKPLEHISINDRLPSFDENGNMFYDKIINISQRENLEDVTLFKLNNLQENFMFVTAGLISVDMDIKPLGE